MALAFSSSPLDRAAHRRRDAAWLAEARAAPATRYAALKGGQPLLANGTVAWLDAAQIPADALSIFLGVCDETAVFAVALDLAPEGAEFFDLRAAAMALGGDEIALLGCAKSLLDWHARHRFCANCGTETQPAEAGWKRECPSCRAEHFPRVDPVVIMIAGYGERCLLGRQKRFPPNMYSALAGYVEPGETVDEACARELFEEAGVTITSLRYFATQPWPFPSSLMVGLIAEVSSDALTIDYSELEDARWFDREEARALLERRHPELFCPPPLAIAHHLLKAWVYP